MNSQRNRCGWVDISSEVYIKYHDEEWGIPQHDDYKLFEMLILEGMQAGLSWLTILKKRENFKKAFDNFDFKIIAKYNTEKINSLLQNKGIIRNKLKISAAIKNARIFLQIQKEFNSFNEYLWQFVNNTPIVNSYDSYEEIPPKTDLSIKISNDLKKRGMNFVGPTIIYSFIQAVGLINDHEKKCYRYREIIKNYC